MSSDSRQRWFALMIEAGLGEQLFAPADVLKHCTPEVLATNLPPELMSKVLQSSLELGAMTPEHVLDTVTPELLAQHVPHEVLWACIADAAEKAGITREDS